MLLGRWETGPEWASDSPIATQPRIAGPGLKHRPLNVLVDGWEGLRRAQADCTAGALAEGWGHSGWSNLTALLSSCLLTGLMGLTQQPTFPRHEQSLQGGIENAAARGGVPRTHL